MLLEVSYLCLIGYLSMGMGGVEWKDLNIKASHYMIGESYNEKKQQTSCK